jgi:uncharacterized OB-fold protein
MMEFKKEDLMGTPLREKDFRSGKYVTVEWKPDLRYAWDDGVGIGYYLRELKEGRLTGCRCEHCNVTTIPPRVFCERCFKPIHDFFEVGDTGTINTFSISNVDWKAGRLDPKERRHTPAVIEIDGCNPDHGILHLIGDCEPTDIKIGMRVKAVWKPAAERTGAITDIIYFKPMRKPAAKKAKKATKAKKPAKK